MGRIRFANQLRGVAALSVACSHWIGVYWVMPDVVSAVTATQPQGGSIPGVFWLVSQTWFNPGPFGVALFFLISGLVVPFSLDQHSRIGFLVARALRIFPTYAAALLMEVVAISAAALLWSRPVPFTWPLVLSNLSLVYDLVGQPSIDLVNWTLSVELKFYLVAAILAAPIRNARLVPILVTCVSILVIDVLISRLGGATPLPSTVAYTISSQSVCIVFMLLGTLFNFHIRRRLSTVGLAASLAALLTVFVSAWRVGVWSSQFPIVTANYVWALALFIVLYASRSFLPRLKPLDWMASISFPFYLIHSLLGYLSLRSLMTVGHLSYYPALAVTFGLVVTLAIALHHSVERPTQLAGHLLRRGAWAASSARSRDAYYGAFVSDPDDPRTHLGRSSVVGVPAGGRVAAPEPAWPTGRDT